MLTQLNGFLSPAPLSPVFQRGGPLDWLNEDSTLILLFMILLFVLDITVVRQFIQPKVHILSDSSTAASYAHHLTPKHGCHSHFPQGRYFALHAVANAISACAAAPDVYRLFADPVNAFSGPSYTMVANSSVAAIHLYHCLAFKLPMADIFHHATFVTILCGAAIPYKQVHILRAMPSCDK